MEKHFNYKSFVRNKSKQVIIKGTKKKLLIGPTWMKYPFVKDGQKLGNNCYLFFSSMIIAPLCDLILLEINLTIYVFKACLKRFFQYISIQLCLVFFYNQDQETTIKTRDGTKDWFKTGKGVHQSYILSHCLFNLYAEYLMWNAGLDEAQAGIKIARRNINNLRYADNITIMTESKEVLKSLLMKVKEESKKPGLKLNSQKTKIMASGPITSWQIDGETMETVTALFS